MVQDVKGNEQFRTYFEKKYSTVFEGSDIIGEIEYTHPANDTGSMKLDVHSSEGIQNHFNGAYDADTSCYIRDTNGNVVASVTPSRSRITKLTVQKGLTVHKKKVLLSQLIKTCIYNYNIHQSLPVFFAITQPTSSTSFIKDTFTCTNYKDAFTNLKQKHRVWLVGYNAAKEVLYYNFVPELNKGKENAPVSLGKSVFTFECRLSEDQKDIESFTLKNRFGEDIIYLKRQSESSYYDLLAPNDNLIAILDRWSCYDHRSKLIIRPDTRTDRKSPYGNDIILLQSLENRDIGLKVYAVKHFTHLAAYYAAHRKGIISSEQWAIAISYALFFSFYKFSPVKHLAPRIFYNYAKLP